MSFYEMNRILKCLKYIEQKAYGTNRKKAKSRTLSSVSAVVEGLDHVSFCVATGAGCYLNEKNMYSFNPYCGVLCISDDFHLLNTITFFASDISDMAGEYHINENFIEKGMSMTGTYFVINRCSRYADVYILTKNNGKRTCVKSKRIKVRYTKIN
jgi:hypothetical protein